MNPSAAWLKLQQELRSQGVTDEQVLAAMESTPRHCFVSSRFRERAYENRPLPIDCGQTISQPSVVGIMTQVLDVESHHKVLEVGTGSGYQAAVLSRIARRVYTIERYQQLHGGAREAFRSLRLSNITAVHGDGTQGMREQAPFDRIIVTAAAEDPPATLVEQLAVGGIMVLPVGQTDDIQRLIKLILTEDGPRYEELNFVRFVPLIDGIPESDTK